MYSVKIGKYVYGMAIASACWVPSAAVAQGGTLTFSFAEVGSDVSLTVSGSISSLIGSGWVLEASGASPLAFVSPQDSTFNSASLASRGSGAFELWRWTSPVTPNTWGTGSMAVGLFQSGDAVQFGTGGPSIFSTTYSAYLALPAGYTLGGPLSSSSIFSGQTLASLGLTSGLNQTYTFGPDTVQIIAVASTPVPEATGSIAGLALAVVGFDQLRRRRRTVTM